MSHFSWAVLFAIILCIIGADLILNDGIALTFLLRKGAVLIEWMAFWR